MKSDNGGITQEAIQWLSKAINSSGKQVIHISDEGAVATDGHRLHAINVDKLPEKADEISLNDLFNMLNRDNVLAEFFINPQYLQDALSEFYEVTKIELVKNSDNLWGIRLTSEYSDKIAFIACMAKDEEDD